jgi:hypothetical protein
VSSQQILCALAPDEPFAGETRHRESVASVEQRYDAAGLWVAIFVTFGWQLVGVVPIVIDCWLRYGFAASGAVTCLVFTLLGIAAAVVALRGGRGPALPVIVCPILLAGSVAGSLMAPYGVLGHFNWAFTMVGWFAVLALWRRPLGELIAFYTANLLAGGILLAVAGDASRVNVARFLALCCGITALQMTVFAGSRMVTGMARRAAEAEYAAGRTRSASITAETVQAARRARYETVSGTVAHLLDGLARGRLDLTDPSARQEVAVAVTRLRRYLVESDEVPDRLWHELQACADAAERRGVAVDLVPPSGLIPPLPVSIRRAVTEPIIAVLAATATRARVTVVSDPAGLAVAIVADAQLDTPVTSQHEAVEASQDADGDLLWVQARWISSSASPS